MTQFKIISSHSFCERRMHNSNGSNYIASLKNYKKNQVITSFAPATVAVEPTYLTIQMSMGHHITLHPEFLQYINHSCDPNVFFNTSTMQLVAVKKIIPEDKITTFYPSTEWDMTQTFHCYCDTEKCIDAIKGAAYLPKELRSEYAFNNFIKQQFAKKWATDSGNYNLERPLLF